MKMKLYFSAASPLCRKVRVALIELGLADLVDCVAVESVAAIPDFFAINPLGSLPTLVTERGLSLFEGSVIIEYLQTRSRGLAALPRGGQRWSQLRRQQLCDGIIALTQGLQSPLPAAQGGYPQGAAAINRALDALELEAGDLSFDGAVRTLDISTGVALAYLDSNLPELGWRNGRERLARWYFSFAQRPSMLAT